MPLSRALISAPQPEPPKQALAQKRMELEELEARNEELRTKHDALEKCLKVALRGQGLGIPTGSSPALKPTRSFHWHVLRGREMTLDGVHVTRQPTLGFRFRASFRASIYPELP